MKHGVHSTSQLSMKVIIQLQYSLADSRVFHDVKNITQSSLHPTQPNPTHGWTQPMTNSATH